MIWKRHFWRFGGRFDQIITQKHLFVKRIDKTSGFSALFARMAGTKVYLRLPRDVLYGRILRMNVLFDPEGMRRPAAGGPESDDGTERGSFL